MNSDGGGGESAREYLDMINAEFYFNDVVSMILKTQPENPLQYMHDYFKRFALIASVHASVEFAATRCPDDCAAFVPLWASASSLPACLSTPQRVRHGPCG